MTAPETSTARSREEWLEHHTGRITVTDERRRTAVEIIRRARVQPGYGRTVPVGSPGGSQLSEAS